MKILTEVRFYLVLMTIAFLSLLIHYLNLQDELTKCKTQKGFIPGGDIQKAQMQETIDSLQLENFNLSHQVGINELVIDELSHREKYKSLKKDIDNELNSNKYE